MLQMPVLFLGHGSPMNVVEQKEFTRGWQRAAEDFPRPKAILCISAHWYTHGLWVSSVAQPETLYDFYGFPPELYTLTYPAPGAPDLAHEVASLFTKETLSIDSTRGLDHGAWSVLRSMYPKADIPVCQLSVNANFTSAESYAAGEALRGLRAQGVLILGSGNVVHNLARVNFNAKNGYPWAEEFDAYVYEHIVTNHFDAALHYQTSAPGAALAVPYPDHYTPLLYVLGAANPTDSVQAFNRACVLGALSMTCYAFYAN